MSAGLRFYVGGEVDMDLIEEARERFHQARSHEHYRISTNARFLFDVLEDGDKFSRRFADSWLSVCICSIEFEYCNANLAIEQEQH